MYDDTVKTSTAFLGSPPFSAAQCLLQFWMPGLLSSSLCSSQMQITFWSCKVWPHPLWSCLLPVFCASATADSGCFFYSHPYSFYFNFSSQFFGSVLPPWLSSSCFLCCLIRWGGLTFPETLLQYLCTGPSTSYRNGRATMKARGHFQAMLYM